MTKYKSEFSFPVAFPSQVMDNVMAEWLAKDKIPQCHVAGTLSLLILLSELPPHLHSHVVDF